MDTAGGGGRRMRSHLPRWLFAFVGLVVVSSFDLRKFEPLKKHWIEGRSEKKSVAEFRNWVVNNPVLNVPPPKQPDITLFLPAHGSHQVTADPTAHTLQLALNFKRIPYARQLILPGRVPLWLQDDYQGRLPCLKLRDQVLFSPMQIATVLDKEYGGDRSLSRTMEGDPQVVLEKTSGFMPALSSFVFDLFEAERTQVFDAFVKQLDILEELLKRARGGYLCGSQVSMADLVLMPLLYHMEVALQHFKGFQISAEGGETSAVAMAENMAAQHHRFLKMYIARALRKREFFAQGLRYTRDHVVYEWNQAITAAKKAANITMPESILYTHILRPK